MSNMIPFLQKICRHRIQSIYKYKRVREYDWIVEVYFIFLFCWSVFYEYFLFWYYYVLFL